MIRHLAVSLLLLSLLPACGSLPSWAGGAEPAPEPKIAGNRVAALPANSSLPVDAEAQGLPLRIPALNDNASWFFGTGGFAANDANLAFAGDASKETRVRLGDGEAFNHTLIARPVVADGVVYGMDAAGFISAHKADNVDEVVWRSKGVREKGQDDIVGGGIAYSEGAVYATSGRGLIAAFDAKTGAERWRQALHIPFRSAPAVAGGRVVALTINNQAYGLDAATGAVVWQHRGISETAGLMNAVSPAVAGDLVVIPYSSGEIYGLSLDSGEERWRDSLAQNRRTQATALFSGIGGDPVVDGEVIFAVSSSGVLAVIHVPSGRRIWERAAPSLNAPWVVGDQVFVFTADQTLACIMKYTGRVRWSVSLPQFANEKKKKDPIIWRGPVMVQNSLALVGSNGELRFYNAEDGTLTRTADIPDGIVTAPVVAGGRMYLVGTNASLYELH